jgi:hypothetical protein
VDDVQGMGCEGPPESQYCADIARPRIARHRQARQTERQMRGKPGQHVGGALPASIQITEKADFVPSRHLPSRQIQHVAEQPTHGGAEDMQDAKRLVGPGHASAFPAPDQNQRSRMVIVSPGRTGCVSGTCPVRISPLT